MSLLWAQCCSYVMCIGHSCCVNSPSRLQRRTGHIDNQLLHIATYVTVTVAYAASFVIIRSAVQHMELRRQSFGLSTFTTNHRSVSAAARPSLPITGLLQHAQDKTSEITLVRSSIPSPLWPHHYSGTVLCTACLARSRSLKVCEPLSLSCILCCW